MKLINKPTGLSKADQGGLTSRVTGRASVSDSIMLTRLHALVLMQMCGAWVCQNPAFVPYGRFYYDQRERKSN